MKTQFYLDPDDLLLVITCAATYLDCFPPESDARSALALVQAEFDRKTQIRPLFINDVVKVLSGPHMNRNGVIAQSAPDGSFTVRMSGQEFMIIAPRENLKRIGRIP